MVEEIQKPNGKLVQQTPLNCLNDRVIDRINASELICADNKQRLLEFIRLKRANSLSEQTIRNYCFQLRRFAEFLKEKKFTDLQPDDINLYIEDMKKHGINRTTTENAKEHFCVFLRWLNGGDKPNCIKHIKVRLQNCMKEIKENELPTAEDFQKLYNVADTFCKRALLNVMFEAGARVSEILSANICDVSFDKYGCVLCVRGKTGHRKLRLVNSAPILKQHIELHPGKTNPDAPLFLNDFGLRLNYHNWYICLQTLSNKAKISPSRARYLIATHNWRHARLTQLAKSKYFNSYQLCEQAGWKQGSFMASRYLHGVGSEDATLRMYGLKQSEDKIENPIKIIICHNCKTENSFDALFCRECNVPISQAGFKQYESSKQKMQEFVKDVALVKMEKTTLRDAVKQMFKDEPELVVDVLNNVSALQVITQIMRQGKNLIKE